MFVRWYIKFQILRFKCILQYDILVAFRTLDRLTNMFDADTFICTLS